MSIIYKDTQSFMPEELRELFLSVNWLSGNYPDKLTAAMSNSATVYSAWEGGKLVGLINALDDGIMTAYIHFLLVNPDYQGKGVGEELLRRVLEKYKDYLRIVLVADDKETGFYQHCGFTSGEKMTPMFVMSL